jgi:hypothetical protein
MNHDIVYRPMYTRTLCQSNDRLLAQRKLLPRDRANTQRDTDILPASEDAVAAFLYNYRAHLRLRASVRQFLIAAAQDE